MKISYKDGKLTLILNRNEYHHIGENGLYKTVDVSVEREGRSLFLRPNLNESGIPMAKIFDNGAKVVLTIDKITNFPDNTPMKRENVMEKIEVTTFDITGMLMADLPDAMKAPEQQKVRPLYGHIGNVLLKTNKNGTPYAIMTIKNSSFEQIVIAHGRVATTAKSLENKKVSILGFTEKYEHNGVKKSQFVAVNILERA